MNIFLGVYACEPNNGSEPEVGWQMVNEIAKAMPDDNIFAITKKNNKDAIEKEGYPKNIKFFYYQAPKWLTFWKKGGRGIRTYYYLWLIGAALFMKKQKIQFDIIHHITFVNDWLPSFFYLLKNKTNKFIWGPIGSNDPINYKFFNKKKLEKVEKITNILKNFYRNYDPFFHICKRKADCIIGINGNVEKKLSLKNKYFISEPAIAVKKSDVDKISPKNYNKKEFTIISVGRLVHIKNFNLAILAYSIFIKKQESKTNIKLEIVGDGEEKKELLQLAQKLDISEHVNFIGKIPLNEVQTRFENADVFLFPTLENAGFVTLEAMSNSLPVVAMKYGGPEQFIKHNIEDQLVSSEDEYIFIAKKLAKNLELFYKNQELRVKIGKQNRQDILDNFTWEAKAQKMKKIYGKLFNEA